MIEGASVRGSGQNADMAGMTRVLVDVGVGDGQVVSTELEFPGV
jgi:hypothetical protein